MSARTYLFVPGKRSERFAKALASSVDAVVFERCIHPKQVAPIHGALAPSAESLIWARRVLAADAASPGAAQIDGRMVDRPVVLQAQRTLQRAGH
jgi:citrate lyase beta subunit